MIVYRFERITKDFHLVIENISLYLKKHYNATIININEDNNSILIGEHNIKITDAHLVMYHPDTDILKAIEFSDKTSPLVGIFKLRNNPNDLLAFSQQSDLEVDNYNFKLKTSIYVPSEPYFDLDSFYIKRLLQTDFIDKFFFRGNIRGCDRRAVDLLQNEELFCGGEGRDIKMYFNEAIQYKIGLSIPGVGELCYRDIEYMAVGIPMMRFEYVTQLNPLLIPNYHYISIDRIDTEEDKRFNGGIVHRERVAEQRHADAYLNKFKEVKDNKEFLEFISKNAREYYETYLHPTTRLQHIINILEIN
jgi:hypothetical protein